MKTSVVGTSANKVTQALLHSGTRDGFATTLRESFGDIVPMEVINEGWNMYCFGAAGDPSEKRVTRDMSPEELAEHFSS